MKFDSPVFKGMLEDAFELGHGITGGKVADYIPALALANPEDWAFTIHPLIDAPPQNFGQVDEYFTIQSISKTFSYSLALTEVGRDEVHNRVGAEPSGQAFNGIALMIDGRPHNPMVNAGAIAVTGCLHDRFGSSAVDEVVSLFSEFADEQLVIDQNVYESELSSGHVNLAIAHLLRAKGVLTTDPLKVIELYFSICSLLVNTRILARMGAVLGRGGKAEDGHYVCEVESATSALALTLSCGMYDRSGTWIRDIGLPTKSGVSGGLLCIVPGKMSMAFWSPPIDEFGNTVRGMAACQNLVTDLDLHLFGPGSIFD